MTVSIGVTACKNEKYTETVRRADNALYRAKNSGRNKEYLTLKVQRGQNDDREISRRMRCVWYFR